ncbi:non-hydrolyzing UDP-N-acetylglucosamine 2-epimerase [Chlorobium phaeovibrioides]|uniref:UDP-N-acetylglucosamine 2-epimerase (non-hydrolyzing) n=1 Tax=Chlorobium phaeovibrioides TaxID=1094 RepID=A0ABW9UPY3_CHLPH|nr:UDP-N-acetylglucosamine 2-epimerase (non-hydrolyzing) [Chlorobium phaeovibrioides]MWV55115.1 UDP-N-acetylglucosamine 2-epimerase (non-hydrolyzing) [Chlorobium phaeovibrioides]
MTKTKVLIVFGTRPEAIKMAPLVKEFARHADVFETVVAVTGQHREMLDQVLGLFGIVPRYDLNIMKQGQDLYDITSRVLLGMRDVLEAARPDYVFVHGDTTTSTATALAAFYQTIPVAHIEAGLRTRNIYSPWPEEMNRQVTGRIASLHFAPTALSRENLLQEHVADDRIWVTGNTVIDALNWVVEKIGADRDMERQVLEELASFGLSEELVRGWNGRASGSGRRLVLMTGHRRENFGEGFMGICNAVADLAGRYPSVDFVYPMHLNPNVRKPIREVFGDGSGFGNVYFIEPLEYLPFVYLMNRSYLVLTDSGGIQEEAPGLGKPVLVMRDTTERPEAVEAGTVRLVGTDRMVIALEVARLLDDGGHYERMSRASNPYGDGKACERVVGVVKGLMQ